jgi:hypothetical protein
MDLWRHLTAERIDTREVTDQVRTLVAGITVDDCFDRSLWPELFTLVQIEAAGDLLPTRADYREDDQWQIGLNPLSSDQPLWYPLADVIVATLLGGRPPRILRAVRLDAIGQQTGLRPVKLVGLVEVDPGRDDFFRTVIEQRRLSRHRNDLTPDQRDRAGNFLKVLASSGCYGIFAESNRIDLPRRTPIAIHGLAQPFTVPLDVYEAGGRYAFPPLAACITAAARLMLALVERLVADGGGSYLLCDTDSMLIVANPDGRLLACPGGPHRTTDGQPAVRALSYAQIGQIVARFAALNPYDQALVPGSILELEQYNFDPETGERHQLYGYAVSAKRYALYNLDPHGRPLLRKWSEHGLGHLLNPLDPDADNRDLAREVWQQILDDALGKGR